ncbi:MAG TPA: DOMON-like domain-containing protein [Verrucomicrobiae bacterium]|nr:DOMON-like domain-containing protein [Verrucomicrobiae bacterium]
MARLLIPLPRQPCRIDGLWQHTCFEAFIGFKDSPVYFEFNFSPSGEWAAYAFRTYRDGGPIENDELDPKIVVRKESETLELRAMIRLDRLPAIQPTATLRVALSAVIEDINGRLSYWALNHPAGKPDFHHPDSFALDITLPG